MRLRLENALRQWPCSICGETFGPEGYYFKPDGRRNSPRCRRCFNRRDAATLPAPRRERPEGSPAPTMIAIPAGYSAELTAALARHEAKAQRLLAAGVRGLR